jgi:hypothetical protein
MLLDLLTIFFIVAGCLLLWFNLRAAKMIRTAMKSRDPLLAAGLLAAAAAEERRAKLAGLGIIADKLEKHLISKKPSDVGLNFERDGARMKLKSRDYTIIIDPGFREYTGMVFIGFPPQIARGSKRGLSTLEDVDAYVLGILQRPDQQPN